VTNQTIFMFGPGGAIPVLAVDNGDGTYSLAMAGESGENYLGKVGGQLSTVSVEVARPNDGNPYIALDTIADATSGAAVWTFPNMARVAGGSGYIVKAQVMTDQKTCVARLRLHLFNAAVAAINDNSPYLTLYANIANRVGVIDFPGLATEDPTNSTQAWSQLAPGTGILPLPFVCAADANLYGILETRDAFTPASGQKFTIKLTADQN